MKGNETVLFEKFQILQLVLCLKKKYETLE